MTQSNAQTNKQRQAAFKERMRAAGFIQTAVWVHPADKDRLYKYVQRLQTTHLQKQKN